MGERINTATPDNNDNYVTKPMQEFGQLLAAELIRWNRRLSLINSEFVSETPEWFGPQWGIPNRNETGGRGLSVLTLLKSIASEQGVKFLTGMQKEQPKVWQEI